MGRRLRRLGLLLKEGSLREREEESIVGRTRSDRCAVYRYQYLCFFFDTISAFGWWFLLCVAPSCACVGMCLSVSLLFTLTTSHSCLDLNNAAAV